MQVQEQLATRGIAAAKGRVSTLSVPPIRILHVLSCLAVGGMERGVLKVIDGLQGGEFEHSICSVRMVDPGFASQIAGARNIFSVGSGRSGLQFPLFRLVRTIKEYQPHVVHTRNFGALEAVLAARLAGVPVIIHSEHGYEVETVCGLPLRRRLMCRALYAMADGLFTVTEELRRYHSSECFFPQSRIQVVYNGVDTQRFAPDAESRQRIRGELGIPANRLVIGGVGRLVAIKSYNTLLASAEHLIRKGKDVHVLLVGSGPEKANLESYAYASPELQARVTFMGASDSVPGLLNAMDLFALPSISEGMSNTILEAMASGLSVVASNTGGNPELVNDGVNGFLFAASSEESLTQSLLRLADDVNIRRKFGFASRQLAVEQFGLSKMMDRYRNFYLGLAAKRDAWKRVH